MTRRHKMEVLHAISVTPEMAEALKALSVEWNWPVTAVVRAAIEQFLESEAVARATASTTPLKKSSAARILPARTSKQAYARYQDRWTQEDTDGQ